MSALLFGNGTDIVHWKASPTTRGTFDVMTICLTTLILCVWTAVHLNVASPESTWLEKFGTKIGWLVVLLQQRQVTKVRHPKPLQYSIYFDFFLSN